MSYLLDTNIVSAFMRDPATPLGEIIRRSSTFTSIFVVAELKFGVEKVSSVRLRQRLGDVLARLPALPFEAPADDLYADLRVRLEMLGTPISDMDMLIAAHALAVDMTLVTDNEDEFRRVPNLRVENWLR